VQNVWGHIDSGDQTATGDGGHARTFTVTLPPWHPLELLAATIGAGPTRQPGAAVTTQPRAKSGASVSPDRATQTSTNAVSP
ncbi:MAG TPA: hypothetical protein VLJ39_00450, partial [Tepidisphaeraceae bacterium]|nr:hypothetical protein [Tepidisphaeraceae bacterium]